MAKEIERKYLVNNDNFKKNAQKIFVKQGYISHGREAVVRIRINEGKGFIAVKSAVKGITRSEFEYEIPYQDAEEMLATLCEKPLIEKNRYIAIYKGCEWVIDEFFGENSGLIMAEIELETENSEFEKPDWVGDEVTHDMRYYNSNLINNPFTKWHQKNGH